MTYECSHLGMLIPFYGPKAHNTFLHGRNACRWDVSAFTDQHFIHSMTHCCML